MSLESVRARVLRSAALAKELGLSQSEIAENLGVSQGQVSRILAGRFLRTSRLIEDVCLYLERRDVGVTQELVMQNQDLMQALVDTWDGSSYHAKALSEVIRSLAALRRAKLGGEV